MLVAGIDVDTALVDRWVQWLMPAEQPYVVPRDEAVVWLDRRGARALPVAVRRAQPTPHRWPARDDAANRTRAVAYVERDRAPSRHRDVSAATWAAAAPTLPRARDLAGTVYVWRDAGGVPAHAAVSLGDGWAMHKESQGWMSPVTLLPIRCVILGGRRSAHRVHRYHLHASARRSVL